MIYARESLDLRNGRPHSPNHLLIVFRILLVHKNYYNYQKRFIDRNKQITTLQNQTQFKTSFLYKIKKKKKKKPIISLYNT